MRIYFTSGLKFRKDVKTTLEHCLKLLGQPSDSLEMSVSFVSQKEIKQLNAEFRNKDSVTDVLSFPVVDNPTRGVIDVDNYAEDVNPDTGLLTLGDVIICLDRATSQAQEYGHSLKREVCFLAVHGLLHLLGYDHIEQDDEQQMTAIQKQVLDEVGIVRD